MTGSSLDSANAIKILHDSNSNSNARKLSSAKKHSARKEKTRLHAAECKFAGNFMQQDQQTLTKDSPEETTRDKIRAWLKQVEQATGLKPTALAQRAGIAPSTLLRFLEADSTAYLSQRTIDKIVATFNVPPPPIGPSSASTGPGFAAPEVELYSGSLDDPTLVPKTPNQSVWRIRGRALELLGYMPGDVALVDQNVAPEAEDVVCAQVYNIERGTAETVFRVYDPPYLITRTADPGAQRKPLLVDGERVLIMGVVLRSLRIRS